MSWAHATIVGNVGKDPEEKVTQSGKKVASFSVATTDGFGENITTNWWNVVVWDPLASRVAKFVKKGKLVVVEGRLTQRSWDDKQTGAKKTVTELVATEIKLLDREKSDGQPSRGSTQVARPAAEVVSRPAVNDDEDFF